MHSFTTLTAATLLAAPLAVNAHYIFSQLIVNDEAVGSDYTYIRKNSNDYQPSFTDDVINSEDMRCNKGATAGSAETYDVVAGDKVAAKLWYNEFIEHPGPGFVYMSLAPDGDVSSYDGSGDWFKVWESGLSGPASTETNWGTYNSDRMEFTIPADLPDGEYLTRYEHIAIHEGHVGKAQFYMECAQLRVSGGGSGTPGPMTQFPGAYTADEVNFDMWTGASSYTMPGPAVWTGGSSGGGSSTGNTTTPTEPEESSPIVSSAPIASSAAPIASMPASSPAYSAPAYSAPPAASTTAAATIPTTTAAGPVYSAPAATSAAAVPSSMPLYPVDEEEDDDSSDALPASFTVEELTAYVEANARTIAKPNRFAKFLGWLSEQSTASSKARRHARAFPAARM